MRPILPFFLAVGFVKPHLPFNAPTRYWDAYPEQDIGLSPAPLFPESAPRQAWHDWGELRFYDDVPESPGALNDDLARTLRRGYYASISYVDAQLGKVLAALEDNGLAENTLVVMIGDHGWSLGDHGLWAKHSTFDVATHTPLIVRVPWLKTAGRAPGLVEFVDIYPTLLDLLDVPEPDHLQGQSFVAQLEQPQSKGKVAVFPRWHQGDVIITDRYALTEWSDDKGNITARMLYDHLADPLETENLAESVDHQAIVKELHQQLLAQIQNE